MDEVELIIKAKQESDRLICYLNYLCHAGEKPVSITEYLSLPWDDEVNDAQAIADREFYEKAVAQDWFNTDWWNN